MHDGKRTQQDNVEILMKVCDAIRFAHDRGVIHRDIKPHNTMIGRYGEVSVMDWGIAVRIDADAPNSGVQTLSPAGTPAYMAPEMASVSKGEIGPATDVYLLGAVLFEIITGEPPHPPPQESDNATQMKREALLIAARNVIVPVGYTGELMEIAYKALATDVSNRYQRVDDFQKAIRNYFSHAESIVLAERGQEHLRQAMQEHGRSHESLTARFDDFDRARFAFEEAIKLWPENSTARRGLAEATMAYAQYAYAEGDYARGIALLDRQNPEHVPLLRKLKAARKRTNRLSIFARVASAVILIGAIGGAAFFNHLRNLALDAEAKAVDLADKATDAEKIARGEAKRANDEAERANRAQEEAKGEAKRANDEAERANKAQEVAKGEARRATTAEKAVLQSSYAVAIGLADKELQRNAFESARATLKPRLEKTSLSTQVPEDPWAKLRNWEWGHLSYLANNKERTTTFALGDTLLRVESVAIWETNKERTIVAGAADGNVYIWSGGEPKILQYGEAVNSVALSKDGKWLAAAGLDRPTAEIDDAHPANVKIWAFPDGDRTREIPTHLRRVLSVAFSRDGQTLLTSAADGTARLWNIRDGSSRRVFGGQIQQEVWSARYSPDDRWIVTASEDGIVRVWDANTGDEVQRFEAGGAPLYTAEFSPDGGHIVFGGSDGRVLVGEFDAVAAADQSSEERKLDKEARLSQRLTAQIEPGRDPFDTLRPAQHSAAVRSISFSHDGKYVFSASHDNTVRVWDLTSKPEKAWQKTLRGHGGWVRTCVASQDGQQVLSAGYDKDIRLWDWRNYEFPRLLRYETEEDRGPLKFTSGTISPDGRWIATGATNGVVTIWDRTDPSNPEATNLTEGHVFQATTGIVFADRKRLLTAGGDNTTLVWDIARGNELLRIGQWYRSFEHDGPGTGWRGVAAVAHNGRWIATGSDRSSGPDAEVAAAHLWDVDPVTNAGRLLATFALPGSSGGRAGTEPEATTLTFSTDDRLLFVGTQQGLCAVFDTKSGARQETWNAHSGIVAGSRFLRDGRLLTAGSDGRAVLWQFRSGQATPTLTRTFLHGNNITAMDVSDDAGRLVMVTASNAPDKRRTTDDYDALRLWDIATGEHLAILKSAKIPNLTTVRAVAIHPSGTRAIVTVFSPPGSDNAPYHVGEWDWTNANTYRVVKRDLRDVSMAVFSRDPNDDQEAILTVGGRGARLWRSSPANRAANVRFVNQGMTYRPQAKVNSVSFSPDSAVLACAGSDGSVKIWRLAENVWRAEQTLVHHQSSVNSVMFHPERPDLLLTASDDGTSVLWRKIADAWNETRIFRDPNDIHRHRQAIFSPVAGDDRLVIVSDSKVVIWQGDSQRELVMANGNDKPNKVEWQCAAFSNNGDWIATGRGADVKIWNSNTQESRTIANSAHITALAFSRDGQRLFGATSDSTIQIWDVSGLAEADNFKSGRFQLLLTLEKQHNGEVTGICLSPTEEEPYLLSTGLDGKAILWPNGRIPSDAQ
jgi:WD40 repeat protein